LNLSISLENDDYSRESIENISITGRDHKEGQKSMTPKVVGIGVGLILGIVWMWLGFWAVLLTGGLALVGWFVGSLVEGTINPVDLWNALQGRRGGLD
jgi:hypothetical protein